MTSPSPEAHAAGTAAVAIRLRGLRKTFGEVVAVDSVDLDIADGEFLTLLGPSGSGKTTVLRMIAGFELPTAGTIELDGVDVTRRPPFDRDVNTVFQDYALFPHMTVQQNVEYGLRVKGVGKAERRTTRDRGARGRAPRGVRRPQARGDVRRPAPARRARPRARQPAQGAPARRAARRPRPQAARADAGRAQGDPARRRHHVRLRDARPGGGADDERPHRRLQRRCASSRSAHRPTSTSSRPPSSSPGSSARRTCCAARPRRTVLGREGVFSVRPEKIRVAEPGDAAGDGEDSALGTVREVVYVGSGTRFVVDLDVGGSLVALQQNQRDVLHGRRWPCADARCAWCGASEHEYRSGPSPRPAGSPATTARPAVRSRRAPDDRRKRVRSTRLLAIGAGIAAVGLLASACGSSSSSSGGSAAPTPSSYAGPVGAGEGTLNVLAWPGYAEDGSTDPTVDWVTPLREGDRLPGERQDVRHLRRGRAAHEDAAATTSSRPPATPPCASSRRTTCSRSTPRSCRTTPTSSTSSRTSRGTPSTASTTASRTAAAPTSCMYNTDMVTPAPTSWAVTFDPTRRTRARSRRTTRPIFIADAAVYLQGDQARAGHHRPVRARRDPVRRRRRPAQGAERAHRRVLVGLHQVPPGVRRPAAPRSAPRGRSSRTSPRPTARPVASVQARRRARPAGRTPG